MPRFSKIDESNIEDHFALNSEDKCYYLYEYTSGVGYEFGRTNDLILNLKKPPSRRKNILEYRYKILAMRSCAKDLTEGINTNWLKDATLVPVPPSKARDHPEYDDRMTQILRGISADFDVDIRELVVQRESMEASHLSESERATVEDLIENFEIDESLTTPEPTKIGIVDDVLTVGRHFKAMQRVLLDRFPGVEIVGIFIARRVFPVTEDMSGDED